MKKAKLMVCFKKDSSGISVKNVYAVHRGGHDILACLSGKNYASISDAYSSVLKTAKANGFNVAYYEGFGSRWYDILWVDCNTGTAEKYSIR